MKGEFAGIGVEYNIIRDTLYALYIVPNGPAAKANMQIADKLIKIGDSVVTGKNTSTATIRKLLRGENNSNVTITVLRNNISKNITIKRGIVSIPSIEASYMLDNKTGYIKLNKFSFTSAHDLLESINALKLKGMSKLIFDLRGNGGGSLSDAVRIVDEFVEGKQLIMYTEGANSKRQNYYSEIKGAFESGNLVVLIDELSASASEVVAGALQDLDRATIIGRRSFGKGLVQRQFGFSDNSGIRLTIAKYYTPSGRSIQKSYANGQTAYDNELLDRLNSKQLLIADSNALVTKEIYKTKSGRTVYGGGGITPDIFVSIDTSINFSGLLNKLYEKNIISNFSFEYYLQNKKILEQFKNASNFASTFQFESNLWKNFEAFCKKDSFAFVMPTLKQKEFIQDKIKQILARQLWRTNGYYEVLNLKDSVVQKAKSVMSN
jgi:carboxyl-terminal processing protease